MRIQWTRVTWYSKLVALALFVALPFIGFWYGAEYGKMVAPSSPAAVAGPGHYYENVAAWETDGRPDAGFSIASPLDFERNDLYPAQPDTDWRMGADADEPGYRELAIAIPRAFEPQTNFVEARLTVGKSGTGAAIAHCLAPDASGLPSVVLKAVINGVSFSVIRFAGAGAGNLYKTTSYRTVRNGTCYAVEYTLHSSQIANYPPEYGIKPFDEGKLVAVLDRIVGTFRFLNQ